MFMEFDVEGRSLEECEKKAKLLYGPRATLLGQPVTTKTRGFLGIGAHDIVKAKGYIAPPPLKQEPNLEAERQKILAEASKITQTDPQLRQILAELRVIHEKIDENAVPRGISSSFEHQNLEQLAGLLEDNEFLPDYRKKILDRMRKDVPIEALDDWNEAQQRALEFIGATISLYQHEKPRKLPRVLILIGPTGVGKTTTIAKLAAQFIMNEGLEPRKISLITTDHYRLAASQQLEKYANILQTPFAAPASADELKKELALQRETADIVLIDTMGRSPRDSVVLGEMNEMLKECGPRAEIHLAVAASTKAADIVDCAAQFEPFRYESVIITKLDESRRAGNVISALALRDKPVSWITDGQESTQHTIHKADSIRLLINLEGFDVDRGRLEERFAPKQ